MPAGACRAQSQPIADACQIQVNTRYVCYLALNLVYSLLRKSPSNTLPTVITEDLEPPIQFLRAIIPYVEREYPFNGPLRTYKIFHSRLLSPPSQQGVPGDFFVGEVDIFVKSERGRWTQAHFGLVQCHPLVDDDVFQDLRLFHDELGPGWTQSQLSPDLQRYQMQFLYIPVAVQFRRALARYKCLPGSHPDHPIHVCD